MATTNPLFSASYTGFVNSENSSVLSGAPALSTTATTKQHTGHLLDHRQRNGTLERTNYTLPSSAPVTIRARQQCERRFNFGEPLAARFPT